MKRFTKKGQTIPAGVVLLILLALFVFYVLPDIQGQKKIFYRISLSEDKIIRYETITMFYEVRNNQKENIENVLLTYQIKGTNIGGQVTIGNLNSGEKSLGNVLLNTRQLEKGSYTIETIISYKEGTTQKTINLNLGFGIF